MDTTFGFSHAFLGVVIAALGVLITWETSHLVAPFFHCCTGWIIRPLATIQIRYYVRHSSTLPEKSNDQNPHFWKRVRRLMRGVQVIQDCHSCVPRESPLSRLLEKWLGGNRETDLVEFTGLASFVLYIPSGWGKTKACEYFMNEKKAKGVMLRGEHGRSYEDTARDAFGGFCRLLSNKDFRRSFVRAMKDEAANLRFIDDEYVVIFFDDWNQDSDSGFADYIMREFTEGTIKVIPVFITHSQKTANNLCYLNRGTRIRPFPECMDLTCEWQVGDGAGEKWVEGAKIDWKSPPWSRDDMAGIVAGQKVNVPCLGMCFVMSSKSVPLELPDDRSLFDGVSPAVASQRCRKITKDRLRRLENGSRTQPLVDVEMQGVEMQGRGIPA